MERLRFRTKFAYGLGQVGQQIKQTGFETFLLFYFAQVLGLSPGLAGLALSLALVFDAVTDPMAGSLSDGWRSKGGRRHPFMYASALPMGIFWYALFQPPEGLGETGLFVWLLCFAVLVRGAMTLYQVPYFALGAELSEDYEERTSVVAYRTLLGALGGALTISIAYLHFFPETSAFSNGMLNPDGYWKLAAFGGVAIAGSIWYSAWGTRDRIPYLPGPSAGPATSRGALEDFRQALANRSFRALFAGSLVFGLAFSFNATLGLHVNVFFWELRTESLAWLPPLFILGFVLGIGCTISLQRAFDKKRVLIATSVTVTVVANIGIVLRLLGHFPANGTSELLTVVVVAVFAMAFLAAIALTLVQSMMADVAQEYELARGASRTATLFSALSFSTKFASSGGALLAGLGLQWIEFPVGTNGPSDVAPTALQIESLGLLSLTAALIGACSLFAYRFYDIDRQRQEEVAAALARRASSATHGDLPADVPSPIALETTPSPRRALGSR